MFTVSLAGGAELIERLDAMPAVVKAVLQTKVNALAIQLQAHVVRDKLSGQVLNVRSGALRRSIQETVEATDTSVTGKVFSAGDVKYAAIHEYGGTIKHPGGTAYLTIFGGGLGNTVFVKNSNPLAAHLPRTKAHLIKEPGRSFLRSALKDMADEIVGEMKSAVVQGVQKAVNG